MKLLIILVVLDDLRTVHGLSAPASSRGSSWRRKSPDLYDDESSFVTLSSESQRKKKPEVMSPAGDWACLKAACNNGADAVYFGLSSFSARARASNFDPGTELDEVVAYCREREVKTHVALNTLVFDDEIDQVTRLIRRCDEAGVDAVIVQDVGVQSLARKVAPSLALHASTQQSISSSSGAEFARDGGASRVVVGRELSISDISRVIQGTSAEIEVFVHGALCVSWSGQCFSSEAWGGRSANRGQCAQACRLPYSLIVDGAVSEKEDDLGYLLSPQDLCGLDQVEDLVEAGVACLKIEGRLKDERYVAAVTRAYRNAVDAACDGDETEAPQVTRRQLAQVFARGQDETFDGLSAGFLNGANHQNLVRGRSPRHRGILLGTILNAGNGWVEVSNGEIPKEGDGVVVDAGRAEDDEFGGRLTSVSVDGDNARCFIDGASSKLKGLRLWRTSDRKVDSDLRKLASPSAKLVPKRSDVRCVVQTTAKSAQLILSDDDGNVASGEFALVAADEGTSDRMSLRSAIGELGDTPWRLTQVDIDIPDHLKEARAADVKAARRAAVADLALLRRLSSRHLPVQPTPLLYPDEKLVKHGVSLLVRSVSQCKAAIEAVKRHRNGEIFRVDEIVLDFLEISGLEEALRLVKSAKIVSVVAAPRILMPDEDKVWRRLVDLESDAILVRSTGLLRDLRDENKIEKRGDFSLNAANEVACRELIASGNLDRITASYDLSGASIAAMGRNVQQLEAVLHCHLPIFHSAHCVFARHLTSGTNYTNCGHACERHDVRLRHDDQDHLVLADMGCRNTVFNAAAQSGAQDLGSWLDAGIKRFRLEFLDESPAALNRIVDAYADLFHNPDAPEPLWSLLTDLPDAHGRRQGVGVGSLRNLKERRAGRVADKDVRKKKKSLVHKKKQERQRRRRR